MRSPDFDDDNEKNGFLSLFLLIFGLVLLFSAPLLVAGAYSMLFYIIGSIFGIVGFIWTIVTALDSSYSLSFLFENEENEE